MSTARAYVRPAHHRQVVRGPSARVRGLDPRTVQPPGHRARARPARRVYFRAAASDPYRWVLQQVARSGSIVYNRATRAALAQRIAVQAYAAQDDLKTVYARAVS